ncbi:hypothetical protein FZI85_27300 [Mycobacterium sp. CBMA293]|uniref:Uncharacterized protein n=1 Tax=Mycolicibacterium sp. CBMA 213 TaxID=1968788 RepID=A0A1S6GKK3_9MYCO|nr:MULTISPECIES: hypothetical protein [unclassified Mycolicibacterium]AQS22395.1 hypothetical protein pCBMA213_2_00031 [Mycolicibacterium sp. CBMA 213]MUL48455.1 hypothetical protein [Mycolicibacterium sp. CBMA 360]MUL62313.1 hypothetical protein [Mycolicibacterium sp. CBMA 335]MUM04450.1 hypothetical protein [Mycolicibacterium sp. CBMA 213]MUM14713.1 hypothetical protein [Mycolicibacterium sp. CBMA 293]
MTAAGAIPAPPPWWDDKDVTLRAIVPDIDDVAGQLIPYARIGGRAPKTYGTQYRVWGDVAGEKLSYLLTHRGASVRTLQRLIDGARDAVAASRMAQIRRGLPLDAAVLELLARLDVHDREALAGRVWAANPVPPDRLERDMGVYSGWIGRHLARARRRFFEVLAEPLHEPVAKAVAGLRTHFGPYVPTSMVEARLRASGVDPRTEVARVLLFAAGPYTPRDSWLENRSLGGRRAVHAAVDALFAKNPAPMLRHVAEAVAVHHMPVHVVPALLDSLPVRRFGTAYVRWRGHPVDLIEAFLHSSGQPLTPEEVAAGIGDETVTAEKVRATFNNTGNKKRFYRATRLTWGLAAWGEPTYRGIAEGIRERIAAAGGSAVVEDVRADLLRTFPDISPVSVLAYMQSWAFVMKDGMIRCRVDGDPLPKMRHWRGARGVFGVGDGRLSLLKPVTTDLLRGASSSAGRLAAGLQVKPGGSETFIGPRGELVLISWHLDVPGAPHLGSLRLLARGAGAVPGDSIILTFTLEDRTVAAVRVPARTPALETLERVTGCRHLTREVVAASLECSADEVVGVLTKRGDDFLARTVASLR